MPLLILFFSYPKYQKAPVHDQLSEIQEVHYQKFLKDHNGCGVEKSGCGVFLGATQPYGVQGS
jgi:hypothetical protein